ncbi:MAG: RNA polymerase factor sigma-54 [Ruminococcaceae bacterium]|jgi:RNA polymerase sigma-54 factor|nr:RNA polymerase factor sigma-54 [Oscillospiraceae bacterium]
MAELRMKQELQQKLYLSPRMVQSMRILQMNAQSLQEYLLDLSRENPALEQEESNVPEELVALRHKAAAQQMGGRPLAPDDDMAAREPGVWVQESLADYLRRQLEWRGLPEPLRRLCGYLAEQLQESGYLAEEDLEETVRMGVPEELCRQAVSVLQSLDPAGVAASDLRTCLLLQLDRLPGQHPVERAIATDCMELLAKHRYAAIARTLGVSQKTVQEAERTLKGLDPRPGAAWVRDEVTEYICPDLVIEQRPEGLALWLDERYLPRVSVSDYYTRLWRETEDPETKAYLKKKIGQANWVIDCLNRRQETLRACGEVILEFQQAYFSGHTDRLRPMTLEDAAAQMGVHPSTVSRCIRDKYLQSPRGLVPLRSLFSQAVGGQDVSAQAIRTEIARLIRAEDGAHPFSDQQLCRMLQEKGITVARRTVAKYREMLGIPPSSRRRTPNGI